MPAAATETLVEPSPTRSPLPGNLIAGAVCALALVAYAGSCASLIFSGHLGRYVGPGMMAALVSTVVTMLAMSRWSSYELSLGGPDSNPSAILALTVAAIAATIISESGGDADALLPTLLMWLASSAVGCGLILVLIGERRWGRCVRFVPYPVMGGFLAGTGYLLVTGSFKMLTGVTLHGSALPELARVPTPAWVTALATGLALTGLMRWTRQAMSIPLTLGGATLLFYLLLASTGRSVAGARAEGLLLDPVRFGSWWHAVNFPYRMVRWDLILLHWNDFLVMTLVVLITCLLNATSIDLATAREVDIDRELKATGIANVLAGLAGGMAVVNSFNRTLLSQKSGAASPWAARYCAAFLVMLMVVFPRATSFVPHAVLTGLILYLGLSLLLTWIWDARITMPIGDYAIVVVIVVIVALAGIVPGVLLGLLIACLNFVFTFSKTPAVKYAFTGQVRRSNVERTAEQLRILNESGTALRGFVLQGHLFFGTASTVLDDIRRVLGEARFIVVDLWLVRGLDSSSAMAFSKVRRLAIDRQAQLVMTGVSPLLTARLKRAGFDLAAEPVRVFPDLDRGLEWCENRLIARAGLHAQAPGAVGLSNVDLGSPALRRYLQPVKLAAGEKVIRQGEASDALYIVGQGLVSVYLHGDTGPHGDAYIWRLRSFGPGTVVGEMGFYTHEPRSADVIADIESTLYRLSRESLAAMEREEPAAAQHFHRQVVATLALRLQAANNQLRLLL